MEEPNILRVISYLANATLDGKDNFEIDEIKRFSSSFDDLKEIIKSLRQNGWIIPQSGERFLTTIPFKMFVHNFNPDYIRSGMTLTGNIKLEIDKRELTIIIPFDTERDLGKDNYQVKFGDKTIYIEKGQQAYHQISTTVQSEQEFEVAAEQLNRYLSLCAWKFRTPIRSTFYSTSSHKISVIKPREGSRRENSIDFTDLNPVDREDQKLALAFYRQFLNETEAHFKILSLIKIIESKYKHNDLKDFIRNNKVNLVINKSKYLEIEKDFGDTFENIVYSNYRHGLAHWKPDHHPAVDPDKPDENLWKSLYCLEEICEKFMMEELGVK